MTDDLMGKAKSLAAHGQRISGALGDSINEVVLALLKRVENAEAPGRHCLDCCCARSWKALGIETTTGKSIVEHIEALKAENAVLKKRAEDAEAAVKHLSDGKPLGEIVGKQMIRDMAAALAALKAENAKWSNKAWKQAHRIDELHEQLSAKDKALEEAREALEKIKAFANKEWPNLENSVLRFKGVAVSQMAEESLLRLSQGHIGEGNEMVKRVEIWGPDGTGSATIVKAHPAAEGEGGPNG